MSFSILNSPGREIEEAAAKDFCAVFFGAQVGLKYVLGRNIYAASIAEHVEVDGFIDDYTAEVEYLGKPIVKLSEVPKTALVINAAGGRPLSARQRLEDAGLKNLDYFSVCVNSGLPLTPMRFNEGFVEEFIANENKYSWVYELLKDDESKRLFERLVSFRFDNDIKHLAGFFGREDAQYFEEFLRLCPESEVFVDVGGFDGFTSLEFIKRCPGYESIHVFEPEPSNYKKCLSSLMSHRDVHIHELGLSNKKAELKIEVQGSASVVSQRGTVTIAVDKLDDVLRDKAPSFIKIDIEGGEISALEGAGDTIRKHYPRLAISVYHKPGDFWKVPQLILSIRDDYDVYMRHYTECIYETIMFFVPRS